MRRVRLSAAVLVAASLVLAGCGGDDEPRRTARGPGDRGGLDPRLDLAADRACRSTGDDSAAQTHPVLVTKIDNTASSAPQIGLG